MSSSSKKLKPTTHDRVAARRRWKLVRSHVRLGRWAAVGASTASSCVRLATRDIFATALASPHPAWRTTVGQIRAHLLSLFGADHCLLHISTPDAGLLEFDGHHLVPSVRPTRGGLLTRAIATRHPVHVPSVSTSAFQPAIDGVEGHFLRSYVAVPFPTATLTVPFAVELFNPTVGALVIDDWLRVLTDDDDSLRHPLAIYTHLAARLAAAAFLHPPLPHDPPPPSSAEMQMHRATTLLHAIAGVDRCRVYAVDHAMHTLWACFPTTALLLGPTSLAATVASTKQPAIIVTWSPDPRWSPGMDHTGDLDVASLLCLPLLGNATAAPSVGVAQLVQSTRGFSSADVVACEILCEHVGAALATFLASEVVARAAAQTRMLSQLSALPWPADGSGDNLMPVVAAMEAIGRQFMHADDCRIVLHGATHHLPPGVSPVAAAPCLTQCVFDVGVAHSVLHSHQPVNVPYTTLADGSVGALLVVPVLDTDGLDVLGVVCCAHKAFHAVRPYFDMHDELLGRGLARIVSLGLMRHAHQRHAHALVLFLLRMASAPTLRELVDDMDRSAADILHADRVQLCLVHNGALVMGGGGRIHDGLPTAVAASGEPLFLLAGDAPSHPEFHAAVDGASVLALPILSRDRTVLAVLHAVHGSKPFLPQDADTAQLLAAHTASTLERLAWDAIGHDGVAAALTQTQLRLIETCATTAASVPPSPPFTPPGSGHDGDGPDVLAPLRTLAFNPFDESKDSLVTHVLHIFHGFHLHTHFRIGLHTLKRFVVAVKDQYRNVPYHNFLHAFTTLHVTFVIVVEQPSALLELRDVLALYVGAMCHDMNHNGRTNDFHIKTRTATALLYNDQSVLENMHAAHCFDTLRRPGHNVLENASSADYMYIRKSIIRVILATDMQFHAPMVEQMTRRFQRGTFQPETDKELLLNAIVHSADIANPTLPTPLHARWSTELMREFNAQYEEEIALGVPPNAYMSAKIDSPDQARMNIGFIDVFCLPLWRIMDSFLDGLGPCIDNIDRNRQYWAARAADVT
ncbi:Aste57867_19972 [Aphanomyces stellatus]|uniref:Phosphodiesterase n=1 Tax=Aphanomyces stellatus TaxID=120398 RepID=A0A485LFT7_9STRA|nr:hypothetical protein As57867_019906 [Aphanomyces stellatus]VFT96669.1 Aste57867_19972 [Aphanomyces stellatus]